MKYETNLNGNKPKTIKSLILDEKGNPLPLREEPKRDWLTGWVSKKFPKVMEASDAIGRLPNTLNPVKTLQTLLDFTGVPGVINNIAGNPMNLPGHEAEASMIPVIGGTSNALSTIASGTATNVPSKAYRILSEGQIASAEGEVPDRDRGRTRCRPDARRRIHQLRGRL